MAWAVNLLILLVTAGVFLYLFLVKKTAWHNCLFFSVFILFLLLFVFRKEFTLRWAQNVPAPVYILVDRSLSSAAREFPAFRPGTSRYRVFYFADTLSEKTNGLNPEFTSLFDAVRALKNSTEGGARIVVFSDFLDNNSLVGFEKTENVYPVLPARKTPVPDYFSLSDIRAPDFYETGEPVSVTATFYSSRLRKKELRVLDGNKTVFSRTFPEGSGKETVTFPLSLPQTGNRILTFALRDPASGETAEPAVRKSMEGISGMQKVLLVAGRPSEEFVFLRRFLEKIRWLKTDIILPPPGRKIALEQLTRYKYNALVLMDAGESQFSFPDPGKAVRSSGIPVFYQPGPGNFDETGGIIRAFTNVTALRNPAETRFPYNNNDLIVLSALASEKQLVEISPKERIFFGWNTWKWDFIRSREDIAYNDYESFWQNQVNFLLNSSVSRTPPVRLNYFFGETGIPGTPDPKNNTILFQTNGQRTLINVGHNPAETAPLPPDSGVAARYRTNFVFADQIGRDGLDRWIEKIRGGEKVRVERKWTVSFADDPVALIIMALSLILFWIFRDREETSR